MDTNNNSAFTKAMQCYKHVVTHYMVSKMELWTVLFMAPVYGVDAGALMFEFARSQGMIHYHSNLESNHLAVKQSQEVLATFALAINSAMEDLNNVTEEMYNQSTHVQHVQALGTIEGHKKPHLNFTSDAEKH